MSVWEKAWLASHIAVSGLVGAANALAPFDILAARVERSGGGSVQTLFESSVDSVNALAASEQHQHQQAQVAAPAPASSASPYGAAVAASLNFNSANSPPASERLFAARGNLDTLAALVASTMFQIQYSVPTDMLIVYLAAHGLRSESLQERRLVHKCLGLIKSSQYLVYLFNEFSTAGGVSIANLAGFTLTVFATIKWGFGGLRFSSAANQIAKPPTGSTSPDISPKSPY
ncbi:hypothetical protein HDU84_004065 [Entophlyctis sp. JEL0112]|nr:hypothetical protein HDU84_004065 [Entophlyctis sp. JEL0112]